MPCLSVARHAIGGGGIGRGTKGRGRSGCWSRCSDGRIGLVFVRSAGLAVGLDVDGLFTGLASDGVVATLHVGDGSRLVVAGGRVAARGGRVLEVRAGAVRPAVGEHIHKLLGGIVARRLVGGVLVPFEGLIRRRS